MNLLASVVMWCVFPLGADPENGRNTNDGEPLVFKFEFEYCNGKVRINDGHGYGVVYCPEDYKTYSIIELTGAGESMHQTFFVPDGTASHSRNTVIKGRLFASQWWGRCERE